MALHDEKPFFELQCQFARRTRSFPLAVVIWAVEVNAALFAISSPKLHSRKPRYFNPRCENVSHSPFPYLSVAALPALFLFPSPFSLCLVGDDA